MGRIIVSELATLDGVFEDPAGIEGFELGGWALEIDQGEEGRRIKVDELFDAAALLFGRVTYEMQRHAWELTDPEFGLAKRGLSMPKYVVSSTLEDPRDENTTVLRGDVVEQVGMLKEELDGDILVPGSATLVRTLFEEKLLDQMRIMVYPVLLGAGRPLFDPDTARRAMRLAHSETVGTGIALFVFEPREPTAEERARGL